MFCFRAPGMDPVGPPTSQFSVAYINGLAWDPPARLKTHIYTYISPFICSSTWNPYKNPAFSSLHPPKMARLPMFSRWYPIFGKGKEPNEQEASLCFLALGSRLGVFLSCPGTGSFFRRWRAVGSQGVSGITQGKAIYSIYFRTFIWWLLVIYSYFTPFYNNPKGAHCLVGSRLFFGRSEFIEPLNAKFVFLVLGHGNFSEVPSSKLR